MLKAEEETDLYESNIKIRKQQEQKKEIEKNMKENEKVAAVVVASSSR
jgi:hypothetical protein